MYSCRKRARSEDERQLDPIGVAACVDMTVLLRFVMLYYVGIAVIMNGDDSFWEDRRQEAMIPSMVDGHDISMADLARWKVIGRAPAATPLSERLFITYFEVEKKGTLLNRAIANCKQMNSFFHQCIEFGLATMDCVMRAVLFFGGGHFAVLDLRHWFHQLSLPRKCRRLFSFFYNRRLWEWHTWPMGFRYTPVVAQTAVCACLREAGRRLGMSYANPEEKLPSAVMVWTNKRGRPVVIAIVWYDNIFINASSLVVREKFVDKVQACFNETRIAVKGEIVQTEGRVEYLGVIYQSEPGHVRWCHSPANVARWETLRQVPATSGRDWLERLGIINWHVRMRDLPWRTVRGLFTRIYKVVGPDPSRLDDAVSLSSEAVAAVDSWLQEACSGEMFVKQPRVFPATRVFLATDASDWGAGGVMLQEVGPITLVRRPWSTDEAQLHINVKESLAAMETIREFKKRVPEPRRITIAIDNMSAKAWLEGRALPETEIELKVYDLLQEFEKDAIDFVWIRSADNAADRPSRNETVKVEEASRCLELLQSQAEKRWFE
ncbi:unnamed protein product [Bodo saltans]|uniref:Reverse transcriptase RNase H-like domain-containing protein n=1 Tax=Bodo saltans TaxID=75058 RepID=A0A0S4JLM1_BODSA|nr:unnamed protein product [Bodo saltans]|eukprot:CUG90817.1 unnamed protein product [Bodo saltans]